eukprot:1017024-Lingulodinium_polyedra.AAC.1
MGARAGGGWDRGPRSVRWQLHRRCREAGAAGGIWGRTLRPRQGPRRVDRGARARTEWAGRGPAVAVAVAAAVL